jgi:hypothetical protein
MTIQNHSKFNDYSKLRAISVAGAIRRICEYFINGRTELDKTRSNRLHVDTCRRFLTLARRDGVPRPLGRRGATSVLVAASGTVLIGFVALAAEGGVWYLALRNATTAADLAALAGAAAVQRGQDGVAAATAVALRNGFGAAGGASVAVNRPPSSGAFAGSAAAVEVLIDQPQRAVLAQLFVAGAPVARARAVAVVNTDEEVCLLALGGGLELGGNSTTNASRCALASNAPSPGGISIVGSAQVRASTLVTTGACSGCAQGDVWTDDTRTARPAASANRTDPVRDPFAGLQSWTPSPPACGPGVQFVGREATVAPGQAICSGVTVGPNETLTLLPGIHYFSNADLVVQGHIQGNGVTIVLTGEPDRVGTVRINAQATGMLRGPATSLVPGQPAGAGVAIYRDARATNNGPQKEVQLNGGAAMDIIGGVYFPTSDVVVNGRSSMGSSCFSIVGYRLALSGSSNTTVDVSGCAGVAPYPVIQTVRLVE